jgi:hypothetical protein
MGNRVFCTGPTIRSSRPAAGRLYSGVRHQMNITATKSAIWVVIGILVAILLSWASTVVLYLPGSYSWLWPVRTVGVWVALAVGVFSVAAYPFKAGTGRIIGVIIAAVVGAVVILTSIVTAGTFDGFN